MKYSIIIPTYRRSRILALCLQHIRNIDYPFKDIEVRVYDNGSPLDSSSAVKPFEDNINLIYILNEPGHGLGYSLRRGATECCGQRILELNDDALIPPDILRRLDAIFDSHPNIGIVGVRAIEDNYVRSGTGIGRIDAATCEIVGNFDQATDDIIDVDHVYGFCYAYTRKLLLRGGLHDHVLLSKDYSSGVRLETDHCLTAKRLGFRVVYDGRIAVRHLAKARADISERSSAWKLNHTRNTLYLFLKHYGLSGKRFLALRYALLMDVGIISAIRHPSKANWMYLGCALRARASAFLHYFRYLASSYSNGNK